MVNIMRGKMESRQMLADRVRGFRKMTGMSQAKLAALAGVSKTIVNNIEHGGNTSLDTLDKLSDVLKQRLY